MIRYVEYARIKIFRTICINNCTLYTLFICVNVS